MAHKYPNMLIHCVFSTKERTDLIPAELLPKLWRYFAGIGRNHRIPILAAGGIPNHVHLLIVLLSDVSVAKAVQILKANASCWIRQHGIAFAWQEGYGASSVSSSSKAAVTDYIEHQAEHHRGRSYEMEFEAMIRNQDCGSTCRGVWVVLSLRELRHFSKPDPVLACRAFAYRAFGTKPVLAGATQAQIVASNCARQYWNMTRIVLDSSTIA